MFNSMKINVTEVKTPLLDLWIFSAGHGVQDDSILGRIKRIEEALIRVVPV